MSDYTQAKSTKALSSSCLVCHRPLRDAASVEAGVGPECRKKINMILDDPARAKANKLIQQAAVEAELGQWDKIIQTASKLRAIGYDNVAEIILKRFPEHFAQIVVMNGGDSLIIKTPFSMTANREWYAYGGVWDRKAMVRRVKLGYGIVGRDGIDIHRQRIYEFLQRHFHGHSGIGPKGPFKL